MERLSGNHCPYYSFMYRRLVTWCRLMQYAHKPVLAFQYFFQSLHSDFRNTPLLVQLFFWYFGVSRFVPDSIRFWLLDAHQWVFGPLTLNWPSYEFIYGFIGLALYTAAYIAEELRAGIKTVPINQESAALCPWFYAKPGIPFYNFTASGTQRAFTAARPIYDGFKKLFSNSLDRRCRTFLCCKPN